MIKDNNYIVSQKIKSIRKELLKATFKNDFDDMRILEEELEKINNELKSQLRQVNA
jgi:hypothetical protein